MIAQQVIEVGNLIIDFLRVLLWPLVLLFVLFYFGKPLKQFANNLGEFTFKAAGVEATAKRQQIEAATLLGAAAARQDATSGDAQAAGKNAQEITNVIAEAVTPQAIRRLSGARVLWVDDRPENNIYERRSLEALGIGFTLSTSTEDA